MADYEYTNSGDRAINNNTISKKKIFSLLALILFTLIFLHWLIDFLTTGKLIVTSNNPSNSITLSQATNTEASAAKVLVKSSKGSLTVKLKAGGYLLSVQGNINGSSRYINIKGHTTSRINVDLSSPSGVEPVDFDNAQDVAADSSRLVYLDPADSSINQINSQNKHMEIDNNDQFTSVAWANTSYGVAQSSSGELFVINNGSISPLKSPAVEQNDSSLMYAVAPNKEIYLALHSSIYKGSSSGVFEKIYSFSGPISSLVAGSNNVAIINGGDNNVTNNSQNISSPSITLISSSGKVATKSFGTFITAWSDWSESDKYLVLVGSSSGEILDTSLHKVATIPQTNFTNPTWVNDNTLFYSVGSQLWSYSVSTEGSTLVANMPLEDLISQISVSSDKAYIYLTTTDSSNNVAIRRVGLKGQKVPGFIYQLQDILPINTAGSGFAIGLYNFSGAPTIPVILADGSNAQASLQAAQQELQSDGFNLSELQFQVEQGD